MAGSTALTLPTHLTQHIATPTTACTTACTNPTSTSRALVPFSALACVIDGSARLRPDLHRTRAILLGYAHLV